MPFVNMVHHSVFCGEVTATMKKWRYVTLDVVTWVKSCFLYIAGKGVKSSARKSLLFGLAFFASYQDVYFIWVYHLSVCFARARTPARVPARKLKLLEMPCYTVFWCNRIGNPTAQLLLRLFFVGSCTFDVVTTAELMEDVTLEHAALMAFNRANHCVNNGTRRDTPMTRTVPIPFCFIISFHLVICF